MDCNRCRIDKHTRRGSAIIQDRGVAKSAPGFTLLELLVVLGVSGFLICLVSTALAMNRTGTNSFQCLNNHRQLIAAWKMYADDNRGRLVYNADGANAGRTPGTE